MAHRETWNSEGLQQGAVFDLQERGEGRLLLVRPDGSEIRESSRPAGFKSPGSRALTNRPKDNK